MALRSREGHHQSSMKTPSWSRSRGSIDISAISRRLSVFSTLGSFEICMTALEKELMAKEVKNETMRDRGWGKQVSRHGDLSDAIK